MFKPQPILSFRFVALAASLLLANAALAQQPESSHIFTNRMLNKVNRIESEVHLLRRKIDGTDESTEDKRPRPRGYDRYGAVRGQLDALEEACDQQTRELRSGSGPLLGSQYDLYRYQQNIAYRIDRMERHLRDIRKYIREVEEDESETVEKAVDEKDEKLEQRERQQSDEEWAEEWAKGD